MMAVKSKSEGQRSLKVVRKAAHRRFCDVSLTAHGKTAIYQYTWSETGTLHVREGETVYVVTLGWVPALDACTCPAGVRNRRCKHVDSAHKLISLEVL